jgi:DNA segregation ATPase FtsK/SpoIIIE, S-DNA-T family
MGIFLGLALASYSPLDPSLNTIGKGLSAHNYCGYFGSFLADILYQMLGLSAWLLSAAGVRLAYRIFRGHDGKFHKLQGLWICLLLLTGASLLALYFPDKKVFASQIWVGGLLGQLTSKALIKIFNRAGVAVILWTAALIWIVFYTEKSIAEIFAIPKKLWSKFVGEIPAVSNPFDRIKKVFVVLGAYFGRWLEEPKLLAATNGPELTERRFLPIEKKAEPEVETESIENEAAVTASDAVLDSSSDSVSPARRKISMRAKVQRRIENWELPKISILEDPPYNRKRVDEKEIRDKAQRLLSKLKHFGITGEVVGAKPGPAVTMFEYKPNADVKISRITDLADDLSLELSSESVRIIAPIPGRDVVGIETSNSQRETVFLKEILASEEFWDEKITLPLALGCEADGSQKVVDLRKMPHLLVAGTTGSGKSVFVVSLLTGLLFRHSPKTLRLILIDPKQVDLAAFSRIPHLLMPPIREPKKALTALRWAIREMDKRYRSMAKMGARDLESFNKIVEGFSTAQVADHETFNQEAEAAMHTQQTYYFTPLPYTIIVVEEFGDLMAVDKSNVENCVVRLAQMARACGIHLILAMQSPRKDVVTGLIKTNIPGRVSFKVASKMDSRIILDESGAERLLTRGDMLFLAPGVSKPQRHHGPWVTDPEIAEVSKFWTDQAEPEFDPTAMRALEGPVNSGGETEMGGDGETSSDDYDERYDEILAYVGSLKEVSASHIQTKFRLGYPRAARLMEVFEQQGVVGPTNGSKKRTVLINELK